MNISLIPVRPGQICKIVSDVPDMEEEEVYIVSEDPADFDGEDDIIVVGLNELQRNVRNPDNAERIGVRKNQLVVVAEDLESYIHSWNDSDNKK
ncbi:hypothetical protein AB6735_15000 [Mucilaginibacter sp. RCC_168]|uniref:hypothetical protein n=1 Tax=Mucilaginibacter sp. RCC_168 TaxID=3239221 RepID=UPI003523C356